MHHAVAKRGSRCGNTWVANTISHMRTLQAQAPGGQCLDLALQPSPDGTVQPPARLLTDEGLHVIATDSGLSASAVLSDALLSAFLQEEPAAQTQVGTDAGHCCSRPSRNGVSAWS